MNIEKKTEEEIITWLQDNATEVENASDLHDAAVSEFPDTFSAESVGDQAEVIERLGWLKAQATEAFNTVDNEDEDEDEDEEEETSSDDNDDDDDDEDEDELE